MFNLKTKEGFCYTWDENEEGNLNGKVFAYLQYKHFKTYLEANLNIEEVIIWSDGCGYQNRNAMVSNAYIHLVKELGVEIMQKYLVSGHTQLECDSMHSTIERKLVGNMFTPRNYAVVFQSTRIRPFPYIVRQVYHNQIMKLSGSYVSNIRPGKRSGDPMVNELRALKYNSAGEVKYKLNFEEDNWEALPQRISHPSDQFEWVRVFATRLPISSRKFKDLHSMKPVMPRPCHAFFDGLPHATDD